MASLRNIFQPAPFSVLCQKVSKLRFTEKKIRFCPCSVSLSAVPMILGYSPKLPKAFFFPQASFQPTVLTTQEEFVCINSLEENNILNRIHKSGGSHPFRRVSSTSAGMKYSVYFSLLLFSSCHAPKRCAALTDTEIQNKSNQAKRRASHHYGSPFPHIKKNK